MTKQKFLAYEKIRQSGLTNMYDVNVIITLASESGKKLTKEDCIKIMLNYDKYRKRYGVQDHKKLF